LGDASRSVSDGENSVAESAALTTKGEQSDDRLLYNLRFSVYANSRDAGKLISVNGLMARGAVAHPATERDEAAASAEAEQIVSVGRTSCRNSRASGLSFLHLNANHA
jgi:hypothetical protein